MTDRELLELAAKAAGVKSDPKLYEDGIGVCWSGEDEHGVYINCWNPLADDGDALRLAVKLQMEVYCPDYDEDGAMARRSLNEVGKSDDRDPYAATRRAIVRAAAEIGRTMG